MTVSRRHWLELSAGAAAAAAASLNPESSGRWREGPPAPGFTPIPIDGNIPFEDLPKAGISPVMAWAAARAPRGSCVSWGIPFEIHRPVFVRTSAVTVKMTARSAQWLVFLHTADTRPGQAAGFIGEPIADYVLLYSDGTEARSTVRRRHQVGTFQWDYGDNCYQAVMQGQPVPLRPLYEQPDNFASWGRAEVRSRMPDYAPWINWLWAWRNPHPEKELSGLLLEPRDGTVVLSALAVGAATSEPLRWRSRRKAHLRLPEGLDFNPTVDRLGLLNQIRLDMGQVISAEPRKIYAHGNWEGGSLSELPELSMREWLIEYTCHPDASFHLWNGTRIPVAEVEKGNSTNPLVAVTPAERRVRILVREDDSGRLVPVRIHLHGVSGEYLAPIDRHRKPNPSWFEDYSPEYVQQGRHLSTYIPGETLVDLPLGEVYVEVTKGFEVRPERRIVTVTAETREIEFTLHRALPWRQRGWVTADTHVHFLSPPSAALEGSAEGVNVVNLLASQWGEMMTNVGDFDGRTTFGSREAGGDGEWLVRVGTENRQRVLGHISLLGYEGPIIAPMCSGGPEESALGDPAEVLLLEWAEQCKRQGGLVIMPHFPVPRGDNSALVTGAVDGVEMTTQNQIAGLSPYSLADYYRYLNCGYFLAAVGGTDKMSAGTAVGAMRTYARLPGGQPFTYAAWKDAVRAGHTFVTCGPLMELTIGGMAPGGRLELKTGGTLDVAWELGSVTMPMAKVELIVNGEIRESRNVNSDRDAGQWRVRVDRSSWLALLVRGKYANRPELIAAHSSPVVATVVGAPFFSAVDSLTILQQLEGALAYIDTIGTRAEDAVYQRMRLRLTTVYRQLHNELHQRGYFHAHTHSTEHT